MHARHVGGLSRKKFDAPHTWYVMRQGVDEAKTGTQCPPNTLVAASEIRGGPRTRREGKGISGGQTWPLEAARRVNMDVAAMARAIQREAESVGRRGRGKTRSRIPPSTQVSAARPPPATRSSQRRVH
jgi:hypothetical protein